MNKTIIGWGRKASGNRAISRALIERKGFSLREDGFLRSVDREGPALSFVQDSQGIYYDASVSSDLEGFIAENLTNLQFSRTRNIIKNGVIFGSPNIMAQTNIWVCCQIDMSWLSTR